VKKLTALFIVLLIMTGAAFAQVPDGFSVGGWGRADFVAVQGEFQDDVDPVYRSGVGSGWGPAYTGFSLKFSAVDGRIGGQLDFSGGVAEGDNRHIWAKPFSNSDLLYIMEGKARDGRFRGPGTDGNFQPFIGGPGKDGDAVFNRFEPDHGALFISKPISGVDLSIFAQLKVDAAMTAITGGIVGDKGKDVYKRIQAGLAYDIAGIGLARAQWYGDTMDYALASSSATAATWNPARIEAAFKVTAIEGLNLDLGIKIPIPVKEEILGVDTVYQDNFQVAAAGDFKAGDFGITYGLYVGFGGSEAVDVSGAKRGKLSSTFDLILVPSFYVAAIDATVGADVGFRVTGESTTVGTGTKNGDQSTVFGFGGWISRDLGKGLIKTGLAYQLPAYTDNGIQNQSSYFSWPIILEVSF
jgi:hypothetical protein